LDLLPIKNVGVDCHAIFSNLFGGLYFAHFRQLLTSSAVSGC
jgi:hypothetical protein